MFKRTIHRAYSQSPVVYQRLFQRLYYRLDPRVSWRDRKKTLTTTSGFAKRFFDSEARMQEYEAEFDESVVGPAVGEAIAQLPEGVSLYDAHKEECVRTYALVREYEPEVVVETGVYNGVSTLSILAALEANGSGRLYSVDYSRHLNDDSAAIDPLVRQGFCRGRPSCSEDGTHRLPPGEEPGWIIPDHLRQRWELVCGKPQTELPPLLARLGAIDFFHHDSSHSASAMLFEFELAWQYLRPGGIAVSNHIGWNDAFDTFVAEHTVDHGLMTWHYNPDRDYSCPGSSGYIVKAGGGRDEHGVHGETAWQEPRSIYGESAVGTRET